MTIDSNVPSGPQVCEPFAATATLHIPEFAILLHPCSLLFQAGISDKFAWGLPKCLHVHECNMHPGHVRATHHHRILQNSYLACAINEGAKECAKLFTQLLDAMCT